MGVARCGLGPVGEAYCWSYGGPVYGSFRMPNVLGNKAAKNFYVSGSVVPVDGDDRFVSLSTGHTVTCGVTSGGSVHCWGDNLGGTCGNGDLARSQEEPTTVAGTVSFRSVSVGQFHTCGIDIEGTAWCWGMTLWGQVGNRSAPTEPCPDMTTVEDASVPRVTKPVRVANAPAFAQISAGSDHTCGLVTSGEAYCWGSGSGGQLGDGRTGSGLNAWEPVAVVGGLRFKQLVTGVGLTCGISVEGPTYCWGGRWGDTGTGKTGRQAVPHPIALPIP